MYRKNVASQFVCFQGVSASTGGILSGATWTMRRCLDGTFAAGGGTITEDGTAGWYKCALTQADTNGNDCSYNFTATGAIPQTINIVTTAADPTNAATFGITDIDAAISSRMATYTQPTGFLAATFPTGTVANQTNITAGTVTTVSGNVNGSVASVTGAVGSVTGAVGSVTAAVTVGTNNDKTGYSTTDWTTQLTESYRANGAAPTPAQAVHEIIAHLGESAISGTTKTVKKLDHATTAETFTLDNASTPASITRAT